ncbi:MAG TPA: glycosyltransferase family 4 protein [Gammaproteobacteria bacterium]|nr:glycosyltransferase family 4 protein [Gammaproteobacteria bacterium]
MMALSQAVAPSRRLRICFIVPAHWEAQMGGSQYQAKMLLEHIAETRAHDIFYLARRIPAEPRSRGYEIRQIASDGRFRRYGEFLDTFELLALLKEISPDVIYQRVGCAYTGVAAYYARKRHKRCVWHVASDRDVTPLRTRFTRHSAFTFIDKRLVEYGLRNVDAIVTQTHRQAEYLWRHYKREPQAVIPNYHPLTPDGGDKSGPTKVVWVANLKPVKQPELFLQLARDLAALKDVELIMIGKPMGRADWNGQIEAEASRLANLKYLGEQPQEVVDAILRDAHVFVNTSTTEGFPNTFIQSWLHSVPVVSLCVNPDGLFDDGRIGICAGTYSKLKEHLVELISNPQRRERMGEDARRHAAATYTNKANLERLAEILIGVQA